MGVDEYFSMVILALMGLTFIALVLAFLYMIYGEKEESVPSSKTAFFRKILSFAFVLASEPFIRF